VVGGGVRGFCVSVRGGGAPGINGGDERGGGKKVMIFLRGVNAQGSAKRTAKRARSTQKDFQKSSCVGYW
jgi:hypothetical protein